MRSFDMCNINVYFTKCFGGQFHQVPYLCTGEPRPTSRTFPDMDMVLYHSGVGTRYARDTFMERTFPRHSNKSGSLRVHRLQMGSLPIIFIYYTCAFLLETRSSKNANEILLKIRKVANKHTNKCLSTAETMTNPW